MNRFVRRFRGILCRIAGQQGHPREIALGFALGIFIGMSPFFLCHTVTAVLLATGLGWNRASAAAGVFITNPLTAPVLYAMTYRIGLLLTGPETAVPFPREFTAETFLWLVQSAPRLLWVTTAGGIVTGIPLAVGGYGLALWIVRRHRLRRIVPARPVCDGEHPPGAAPAPPSGDESRFPKEKGPAARLAPLPGPAGSAGANGSRFE